MLLLFRWFKMIFRAYTTTYRRSPGLCFFAELTINDDSCEQLPRIWCQGIFSRDWWWQLDGHLVLGVPCALIYTSTRLLAVSSRQKYTKQRVKMVKCVNVCCNRHVCLYKPMVTTAYSPFKPTNCNCTSLIWVQMRIRESVELFNIWQIFVV